MIKPSALNSCALDLSQKLRVRLSIRMIYFIFLLAFVKLLSVFDNRASFCPTVISL